MPWVTVWLAGETDKLKSGAGFTTIFTVVVCVRLPLTPVIVSVLVPTGVVAAVVTESVVVPVAGLGVKLPPAPAGNPLTLNVTCPVKPLLGFMVRL